MKRHAYKIIVSDFNLYYNILSKAFSVGYGWPSNYYRIIKERHNYILLQDGNINSRMLVTNDENEYIKHHGKVIDENKIIFELTRGAMKPYILECAKCERVFSSLDKNEKEQCECGYGVLKIRKEPVVYGIQ